MCLVICVQVLRSATLGSAANASMCGAMLLRRSCSWTSSIQNPIIQAAYKAQQVTHKAQSTSNTQNPIIQAANKTQQATHKAQSYKQLTTLNHTSSIQNPISNTCMAGSTHVCVATARMKGARMRRTMQGVIPRYRARTPSSLTVLSAASAMPRYVPLGLTARRVWMTSRG